MELGLELDESRAPAVLMLTLIIVVLFSGRLEGVVFPRPPRIFSGPLGTRRRGDRAGKGNHRRSYTLRDCVSRTMSVAGTDRLTVIGSDETVSSGANP